MKRDILFIIIGYLSGSILFAEITARLAGKSDLLHQSRDGNPGTANALTQCGPLCALITLAGDVLKGFLPIFCYARLGGEFQTFFWLKILVLAAPVLGHAFPLFFNFHGGKAIAVTFGCLLGLLPIWQPLVIHIAAFLSLTVIVKIYPHSLRTALSHFLTLSAMLITDQPLVVILGFTIMTAIVLLKHFLSKEPRIQPAVKLLWMHCSHLNEKENQKVYRLHS